MTNLSTLFPAINTFTGDASAHHILPAKKAWVDGVELTGTGYFPAMMKFDGSTGYYSHTTLVSAGNKVTAVFSLNRAAFSADDVECFFWYQGPSGHRRASGFIYSDPYAATPARSGRVLIQVRNSAGAVTCQVLSPVSYEANKTEAYFFDYDGDAGTVRFLRGHTNINDTASAEYVAPSASTTLDAGVSSDCALGATITPNLYFEGSLGFFGIKDVAGLTPGDFMQDDGSPKNLEGTLNTVWGGSPPLLWHESGMMTENKGSAGAMTKNGTITLAAASTWL